MPGDMCDGDRVDLSPDAMERACGSPFAKVVARLEQAQFQKWWNSQWSVCG